MPSAEPSRHASPTAYVAARNLYCDSVGIIRFPAELAGLANWLVV